MDILSQLPKNKNSIILEQMMNYLDKNYSMWNFIHLVLKEK
jgi:hypothetical protein